MLAHPLRLSPQDVQGLLDRKRDEELSANTRGLIHAVLRRGLNLAQRWALVGRNVAALVEAPRVRPKKVRPFTPDELRRILIAAEAERLHAWNVVHAAGLAHEAHRWDDGRMKRASVVDPASAGWLALAAGEWSAAADAFALALATGESPDALDGLGMSLWWMRDTAGAIEVRTRAFAALRRDGRGREAVRVAVWLAREYRTTQGRGPVAAGWLARARRAQNEGGDAASAGWIALAESEATSNPRTAIDGLSNALDQARDCGDPDLEIMGLARLAVLQTSIGRIDDGLANIDEAMAAATSGEGLDPQSIGEACCALIEIAGLLGDSERVAAWAGPIERFQATYRFPQLTAMGFNGTAPDALSAFCGTCCGGLHLVTGRLDDAEQVLRAAIDELRTGGMSPRCVHPASQLAELRVLQGRFEDAEALLAEYDDRPDCVRPLAALELARGSADHAAVRLRTAIDRAAGRDVAALPLWMLLVDVDLTRGDFEAARDGAAQVVRIAKLTGSVRHAAQAGFAQAKVTAAADLNAGRPLLRDACIQLADAQVALDACRARLAYAKTLVDVDRPAAISEARAAMTALDRLGATIDADAAAMFLRDLGVRGRTGPKDLGLLTGREHQVLRLVSEGLTNSEIADRLRISVKTAGHHVSNILTKLGLRSRTEAAAWAVLHQPTDHG